MVANELLVANILTSPLALPSPSSDIVLTMYILSINSLQPSLFFRLQNVIFPSCFDIFALVFIWSLLGDVPVDSHLPPFLVFSYIFNRFCILFIVVADCFEQLGFFSFSLPQGLFTVFTSFLSLWIHR
jgi:hypothetical protein